MRTWFASHSLETEVLRVAYGTVDVRADDC